MNTIELISKWIYVYKSSVGTVWTSDEELMENELFMVDAVLVNKYQKFTYSNGEVNSL